MLRRNVVVIVGIALVGATYVPPACAVDPNVVCHKTVVRQLERYKRAYLKKLERCLDLENEGKVSDCPDAVTATKLAATNSKVAAAIAKKCTLASLDDALGFRNDCHYGADDAGVGGQCFDLPVTTPQEFAECLKCWKRAELARYIATVYASHAQEICGPALDDTSLVCRALGCTTPLPDQRDLDGAERDCQRAIGKAAVDYLLKRERTLETCLLKRGTLAACLADPKIQLRLASAEVRKETVIDRACNNRDPIASPPFCCRTGTGNSCSAASSRTECTDVLGGTLQEGKQCGVGGTCENPPGNAKAITWWEHCPTNASCPGPTLSDDDDVADCIDTVADGLVGGLLCLQFPGAGACPTVTPTPTPSPSPTPTFTPPALPCVNCVCPPLPSPTPVPTCTAGCPTPTGPTPAPTASPPPCGAGFDPPSCGINTCPYREVCVDAGGECGCAPCCPCP